ncbi:MAG: hypothetical protein ABJ215_07015 [Alphaproteobacteria bacterium]
MIALPHRVFILGYVIALTAVTILSLIPQPELDVPEGTDKALHLLAYGVIAGCGGLGFSNWDIRIISGTTAIGVGILLEFAQGSWVGRNASVGDALSNSAGVFLGLAVAYVVLRLWAHLFPVQHTR